MNALAGLMNPAAIGQQVTNAFDAGVQKREQRKSRNALTQYAVDPSEGNFAQLAQYHPEMAIQQRGQMQKQQQEQRMQELRRAALAGDQAAQIELATLDTRVYERMDDQQRAQVDAGDDALAEAAFDIVQTQDPAARAAKWDQYAQQLGRPEYVGQYSDQMMNTIVARAGIQERFQKFRQPDYVPVGEGGLAGFQYGQPMNGGGNMAPAQNGAQGAAILQGAATSGTITAQDAERVRSSLGPNGAAQFEKWKADNGIRVVVRTGTDANGRKVMQFEDGTVDYAD